MNACGAACAVSLILCLSAGGQSFTPLGGLPGGSGVIRSEGRGVSRGGAVVVGDATGEAFRWTEAGGMQGLEFLPGDISSGALGVSDDGSVVVGVSRQPGLAGLEAFRWSAGSGLSGLGFLPGHDASIGWGASADGSTIVGRSEVVGAGRREAFRWTEAGGMQGLGYLAPAHVSSEGRGVSADGSVVAGTSGLGIAPASPREAFRWKDGVMTGLGFLPGDNGSAGLAVSGDGATVAGGSFVLGGVGSHPFRWTEGGGMEYLGLGPDASNCDMVALNHDGTIGVGTCYTAARAIACIWTPAEGIRSLEEALVSEYGLELSGWILITANAISADGRAITGRGVGPAGTSEAFVAILFADCYADCDDSGELDFFDFLCFQNLFGAGAAEADCDGSGSLDFFDCLCFQNAFAAGCA